jgi:hypothetical protein
VTTRKITQYSIALNEGAKLMEGRPGWHRRSRG